MMLAEFVHESEHQLLDVVRLWHAMHEHFMHVSARALDMDGAEVEHSLEEAAVEHSRVLHTLQRYGVHFTRKEPDLFDMHYASVSNDPHIEVMVGPFDGEHHPDQ